MFKKLYGGLLAAAWQNACNLHAPNDTHMLVYRAQYPGYMGENETIESSRTVSFDRSVRLADHLMDNEKLLGIYALCQLTEEDKRIGSDTFDEKFKDAKVSYDVVDGQVILNTAGEYPENVVALDACVA